MKLSNSYFFTMRENAKDEDSISGNLLVRSGMIKKSSSGIYIILPMGKKVLAKIEHIVREEMDFTGAQELLMPALISEDLYEMTGRRSAFGNNMFCLKDRYDKAYALGPTHEEMFAIVALMKKASYKDFPYTLYQIQTKYRDETRPRFGLIRVREFIMKDAYSFDVDEDGLAISYNKMFEAYKRIFDRMNLNYKIVQADTGAMGGSLSEEFQAISQIGEDVVVTCNKCDYASNLEISEVVDQGSDDLSKHERMEYVKTPSAKTIDEVSAFLNKAPSDFVKTLIYKAGNDFIACLLRGKRLLNENKVCKLLGLSEIELASFEDVIRISGANVGYAGPVNLKCKIIMDREISHMANFIVGANMDDTHIKNVNLTDFKYDIVADIAQVVEGDTCVKCGGQLSFEKAIEVGNTFKLGTKYAQAMNLQYCDANNKLHPVVMGSYGIGLERCMAAIVEQYHDDNGINWPKHLAPYSVVIIVISLKDEQQVQEANKLYLELQKQGVDVLLDDRDERLGVKFKDSELIGIPQRIVVGQKISENIVEYSLRACSNKLEYTMSEIVKVIIDNK